MRNYRNSSLAFDICFNAFGTAGRVVNQEDESPPIVPPQIEPPNVNKLTIKLPAPNPVPELLYVIPIGLLFA